MQNLRVGYLEERKKETVIIRFIQKISLYCQYFIY